MFRKSWNSYFLKSFLVLQLYGIIKWNLIHPLFWLLRNSNPWSCGIKAVMLQSQFCYTEYSSSNYIEMGEFCMSSLHLLKYKYTTKYLYCVLSAYQYILNNFRGRWKELLTLYFPVCQVIYKFYPSEQSLEVGGLSFLLQMGKLRFTSFE